jgi:hypothetical protein
MIYDYGTAGGIRISKENSMKPIMKSVLVL